MPARSWSRTASAALPAAALPNRRSLWPPATKTMSGLSRMTAAIWVRIG